VRCWQVTTPRHTPLAWEAQRLTAFHSNLWCIRSSFHGNRGIIKLTAKRNLLQVQYTHQELPHKAMVASVATIRILDQVVPKTLS